MLGVAGIGALTTFSTLSDDVVGLTVRRPVAAIAYLVVWRAGGGELPAVLVGMVFVIVLRVAAIYRGLHLPTFPLRDHTKDEEGP